MIQFDSFSLSYMLVGTVAVRRPKYTFSKEYFSGLQQHTCICVMYWFETTPSLSSIHPSLTISCRSFSACTFLSSHTFQSRSRRSSTFWCSSQIVSSSCRMSSVTWLQSCTRVKQKLEGTLLKLFAYNFIQSNMQWSAIWYVAFYQ